LVTGGKCRARRVSGTFIALQNCGQDDLFKWVQTNISHHQAELLMDMDKRPESLSAAQARQIVQEYQQVLYGVAALLTLGAPETLLPAAKDEIRQALRIVARATASDGSTDSMALDALRTAYLSLASFLTYEEANGAARLQAAFNRGDRAYISSRAAAQTVARAQRIEQEASALAREFDELLKQLDSDGLLSEIDSFLAEFSHKYAPLVSN
jgi:hypothetical protein